RVRKEGRISLTHRPQNRQQANERRGFIKHMLDLDYELAAVAIHKPSIHTPDNFKKRYFLYFYAVRLLLEAFTKPRPDLAKERFKIVFSSRKGLSTEAFEDYMDTIRGSPFVKRDYVDWSAVAPYDVECVPNRTYIGLQMADCFASAVGKALEHNEHDMTECSYVRQLAPRVMRVNGSHKGYGIKLWPMPTGVFKSERFRWFHEI
uniref:hypothetical protein n=1 Tax=Bosea sp. (in: a-proteobacteria) TaxID=1871050 RepID=UPI002FC8B4F4